MSKVLLDMDGVLVDFIGPAMSLHRAKYAPDEWPVGVFDVCMVLGITATEFWAKIDRESVARDWWRTLPKYKWCDELVSMMPGDDWHIATSPSCHPCSHSGKVNWLHDNISPRFRRYMLGPDKWLMANHDRILIDDAEHNVGAFRACGGRAILFPQPWNSNHHLCGDRMDYVRDQLKTEGAT